MSKAEQIRSMVEHDAIDAHTMLEREKWSEYHGIPVSEQVRQRVRDMLVTGWNYYGLHSEAVY